MGGGRFSDSIIEGLCKLIQAVTMNYSRAEEPPSRHEGGFVRSELSCCPPCGPLEGASLRGPPEVCLNKGHRHVIHFFFANKTISVPIFLIK
jgi:hypothetical protein